MRSCVGQEPGYACDADANVYPAGDRCAPQVPLPTDTQPQEMRIELRGGAFAATVLWPMSANAECAGWLRKLLR